MRTAAALLLFCALLGAQAPARKEAEPVKEAPKIKRDDGLLHLAVIVNKKNPVTDLQFSELRAIMTLERQFWPDRHRVALYLPRSNTAEHKILLAKIYKMSTKKLRKYWVLKMFSGDIPAKPAYVPSAKAAAKKVRKSPGAVSVVRLADIPKGVRVLLINGLKPGQPGYPLAGKDTKKRKKKPKTTTAAPKTTAKP